jgi:predicted amidohydrolase
MMPCGEILWPETARCLALRRAEVILHPASDHGRDDWRRRARFRMPSRASSRSASGTVRSCPLEGWTRPDTKG